ncbi:MAG: hypothetical protein AB7N80_12985 [Bdellovibrionales bacterium]
MTFDHFLNQAWNDHAENPKIVRDRFAEGLGLIGSDEQVASMAHLITHVMGEHLGEWQTGVDWLMRLEHLPAVQEEGLAAISRSVASLRLAKGQEASLTSLSRSDQIRACAVAASALCGHQQITRANELLQTALGLAESGLPSDDPAHRSLAATGHNLACTLEEKIDKNPQEIELMILAARTSRIYWQIAGTWLEVSRAEYRLANTYLQAKDLDKAYQSAQNCLQIAEQNQAPALELFFAYEAQALVEKARQRKPEQDIAVAEMKKHFAALSPEDQKWCEKTLLAFSPA